MNILDFPMNLAIIEYFYYDSADYLEDYIDEFLPIMPEELQKDDADIDDQVEWLCKFLDDNFEYVDNASEYVDLEGGYEELALIFKVGEEYIGVPFCDSAYNGLEMTPKKLGEYPRYKPVQKTVYERIYE